MLTGKTAVVTGGSRGIGEAIALKLASLGANVAVIYAGNTEKAEMVVEKCRNSGVKAISYKCDVSDFAAVKETVAKIKADFGSVQILANNAGITRDGLLAMMKESDFDDVLDTNLKGAFNMIRHVTPAVLKSKRRLDRQYLLRFGNGRQCGAVQLCRLESRAYRADEIGRKRACLEEYPVQCGCPRVHSYRYDRRPD